MMPALKVRNPERKNVEESHMDEIETRPWSDLPQDLIVSIMERLYVADRVRLRAVCKGWHLQPNRGIKAIDKLPWTMEYKWRNPKSMSFWSVCKLYEPLHHNRRLSYMVEKDRIRGRKNFANAEVRASRYSWVLFYKDDCWEGKFFFFNPFTKEVIFLPILESPVSEFATFSLAPTSPDCFVFVPYLRNCNKISINIYSHADKTWKTHDLVANDHPLGTLKAVGYMEGTFYCHFCSFQLAAFNIADQEVSLVMTTCPALDHLDDSLFYYLSRSYLLECDGDLLLVYLLESFLCWHQLYVLKLDWSRNEWVRVSRLGGRAMFLGETSFCVSAGGETEIIANRIYYHHDGVPEFQTLDLCSFDEYDSQGHDYLTWEKEKKGEAGNAKIYGCCRKSLKTIWIQPP
ncbi:hypothetical protein PVL29_018116 [Vitis rotundifolia]|uniref:F-box domain-containing protein n=1 Tax=Vitis rotundifolia TaxID=103349 RepID=A0AA38Z464_VITRO|nr:hypothetical protein PVL29_018116 [Vitis rotundifolia]